MRHETQVNRFLRPVRWRDLFSALARRHSQGCKAQRDHSPALSSFGQDSRHHGARVCLVVAWILFALPVQAQTVADLLNQLTAAQNALTTVQTQLNSAKTSGAADRKSVV